MNLSDLTKILAGHERSTEVFLSLGVGVRSLDSWRGDYSEATLTHAENDEPAITAGALYDDCMAALDGRTFQGYKGGDYTFRAWTPVWADDYGDCTYWAITGHHAAPGRLVLDVIDIGDYA